MHTSSLAGFFVGESVYTKEKDSIQSGTPTINMSCSVQNTTFKTPEMLNWT